MSYAPENTSCQTAQYDISPRKIFDEQSQSSHLQTLFDISYLVICFVNFVLFWYSLILSTSRHHLNLVFERRILVRMDTLITCIYSPSNQL